MGLQTGAARRNAEGASRKGRNGAVHCEAHRNVKAHRGGADAIRVVPNVEALNAAGQTWEADRPSAVLNALAGRLAVVRNAAVRNVVADRPSAAPSAGDDLPARHHEAARIAGDDLPACLQNAAGVNPEV